VLIVIHIPIIGKYIRILETMMHELGHVAVALLVGVKINKINLFSNSSGETHVQGAGKPRQIWIALAGYPFSAAVSWIGFWMLSHQYHSYWILVLCIITLICVLFYIRNPFGICWAILLLMANGLLLYFDQYRIIRFLASMYACVLFISSIRSCFTLLHLAVKNSSQAGDASAIAKITHLPTVLIAFLFLLLNLMISWKVMTDFFPMFPQYSILDLI
jgi:hypothetical protein